MHVIIIIIIIIYFQSFTSAGEKKNWTTWSRRPTFKVVQLRDLYVEHKTDLKTEQFRV